MKYVYFFLIGTGVFCIMWKLFWDRVGDPPPPPPKDDKDKRWWD